MGRETSVFPVTSHLMTEYLIFLYKIYQFPDESLAMTHLAIRSSARCHNLRPCSESRGSPLYYTPWQLYIKDIILILNRKTTVRLTIFLLKLTYLNDFLQFQ